MDLKNIDLKNIKFDEIISKIKTIEKKVLIKIGIGVGSVVVFLIIYYAILSPIVEKKKIQLEDMNVKKTEITKFNNDIVSIKKKIKKVKPEYENYSTLFHSKSEVEGLYQTLSEYASLNGLVISKINKGNLVAVTKSSLSTSKKKRKKRNQRKVRVRSHRKKISLITGYPLVMKLKAISLVILSLKDKSPFLKRC